MKNVKNLKMAINEAKERILIEAKKKALTKEYREGKKGKILPLGSSGITHVEAFLTDKDLPKDVLAKTTTAAQSIIELNDQIKAAMDQLTEDKEFLRPLFDDLFDEGDKLFTRVLRTVAAGKKGKKLQVEITSGKAGTNTKFDHKRFVQLIKENLKDQITLIDELAKQCTNITETANSIRVDIEQVKESVINEGVLASITKKLTSVVKNAISSVTKHLKNAFKSIDARQKEIDACLTPELREEADNALVKFGIVECVNEDYASVEDVIELLTNVLDKSYDTHHLSIYKESDGTAILKNDFNGYKLTLTKAW